MQEAEQNKTEEISAEQGKQGNYQVNRKRLLQQFLKLTAIDAESYHERKMAKYLKEQMQDLGIEAWEDDCAGYLAEVCEATLHTVADPAGNVWAVLPGNLESEKRNKENAILFGVHMDTVSPGNSKKAKIHDDGTITSDGTTILGADDAAGIAEVLEALCVLQERNLPHPDIELLFAAAEEPYCQGSSQFDFGRFHAKYAYVMDLSGDVGTAALSAPAIYSLTIRVKGRSAHAGFAPENGVHAIAVAAKAVADLPFGHVEENTTVNLGTIQGGTGKNIVPEEVVLTGEICSMDTGKAEKWSGRIRKTFEKYAQEAGATVEFLAEKAFDAYEIEPDAPVVKLFEQAAGQVGLPVRLIKTFGGSDNNHINAGGISGIVLANAMYDAHTLQESTNLTDMERCTKLLLEIIRAAAQ